METKKTEVLIVFFYSWLHVDTFQIPEETLDLVWNGTRISFSDALLTHSTYSRFRILFLGKTKTWRLKNVQSIPI